MKTENLAILLTDIAGFTEAMSQQSRAQSKYLLERHNQILLPIVKRYRGRHVKSIGDALLLTFRSPTDAMLCAMAMQDALHEYNRQAAEAEEIHIRIAASLGEVRVTGSDIFGEPVNVTSRIEGITPADEIYFSEAIYLAMNKAEVPTREVGQHEFKGVAQPLRIYCIPPYTTTKLVPDQPLDEEKDRLSIYPFGGAHLTSSPNPGNSFDQSLARLGGTIEAVSRQRSLLMTLCGIITLAYILAQSASLLIPSGEAALTTPSGHSADKALNSASGAGGKQPEKENHGQPEQMIGSADNNIPRESAAAVTVDQSSIIPAKALLENTATRITVKAPRYSRFSQLKTAYNGRRITKQYYSNEVRRLKIERNKKIEQLKISYRAGRMDKTTYKQRHRALVLSYE